MIDCAGTLKVTLALSASPDITSAPTDIVLILDRSGSMAGNPLVNLKSGAKKFIDIIDEATDSSQDGQIGSGSRIGIVSFATNAVQDTQLITSVDELKAAVDALRQAALQTTRTLSRRQTRCSTRTRRTPRSWSCSWAGKPPRARTPTRSQRPPARTASSSTASA